MNLFIITMSAIIIIIVIIMTIANSIADTIEFESKYYLNYFI